jgi:hypothetical protein
MIYLSYVFELSACVGRISETHTTKFSRIVDIWDIFFYYYFLGLASCSLAFLKGILFRAQSIILSVLFAKVCKRLSVFYVVVDTTRANMKKTSVETWPIDSNRSNLPTLLQQQHGDWNKFTNRTDTNISFLQYHFSTSLYSFDSILYL